MRNKPRRWVALYIGIVIVLLVVVGGSIVYIDPFFHFHNPRTESFFYPLLEKNERNQNDGITRRFKYDGLITGTSMTQNFKVSEATSIFNGEFIKVCYAGASYKEINDSLQRALSYNPELNTIIRGLDYGGLIQDKDSMRNDLGSYPDYLYDDTPWNDLSYVFNRSAFFESICPMLAVKVFPFLRNTDMGRLYMGLEAEDVKRGYTSFDDYSNWMSTVTFGHKALFPIGVTVSAPLPQRQLTSEDSEIVLTNIRQNVTDLADEYPDVRFYYFFTPYSAAWWQEVYESGELERQIEAETIAIKEILKHPNIKIFSINDRIDITGDLNNYKDYTHYGEWVNSLLLRYMSEGKGLLTKDNYDTYLQREEKLYSTYDYKKMEQQEDYEDDHHAAELMLEK